MIIPTTILLHLRNIMHGMRGLVLKKGVSRVLRDGKYNNTRKRTSSSRYYNKQYGLHMWHNIICNIMLYDTHVKTQRAALLTIFLYVSRFQDNTRDYIIIICIQRSANSAIYLIYCVSCKTDVWCIGVLRVKQKTTDLN